MIKLSLPVHGFSSVIDDCVAGIAHHMSLRGRTVAGKSFLVERGGAYDAAARDGGLYAIESFDGGDADNVCAELTKGDLLKLYDQYLVPGEKVARRVYDSVMSAALEKCPFCGGIGTPRNLDHFLPKAHFPQFSILPTNLIPACRDCNMDGKLDRFAVTASKQIIHPYLEESRFFERQWIFASYLVDGPDGGGRFEYFVRPPDEWSDSDKERVKEHFEVFNIPKRYAVKAGEYLPTVLAQMNSMSNLGLGRDVINEVLLLPGVSTAPFANHWQTAFYQALIAQP